MIVIDASAVADMLLRLEPRATRIRERLGRPDESLHAPHLIDAEVLQTLRRYALNGVLSPERSAEALDDLKRIRVTRYPHAPLVERVWELRNNLSAYDASYVALAEALGAPLVTSDGPLARAPGYHAEVELYE